MTEMIRTSINGRWSLLLPEHRARRPETPWWEAQRLAAMHHVIKKMYNKWAGTIYHSEDYSRPLVVDVGAEEGDLSALYSLWGADVALFEPNERVWANIRAIWDANNLRDPLFTFAGFAADMSDFEAMPQAFKRWPPCASGPVIGDHGFLNLCERPDVFRQRLDQIDWTRRVDVITIDVEGAELRVLLGAEGILREDKPVVFCSIHRQFMLDMYGDDQASLHDLMRDHGYEERFLCTDHEAHWVFQHPDNKWMET